jgi:formate dehydrogenase subunit beta
MDSFAAITTDGKPNQAFAQVLRQMLEKEIVSAVMVPARQSDNQMVMQTLITDPVLLQAVDPFAPVAPTSSAKLAAALTARPSGRPVAVVLRNCELRAFIELVKLHQGSVDDLTVIGVDCLGRYENRDYLRLSEKSENLTQQFLKEAGSNDRSKPILGAEIATSCKCCEQPIPQNADLNLCVIGGDPAKQIWLQGISDKGRKTIEALGLSTGDAPGSREEAIEKLVQGNRDFRKKHLSEFIERTSDIEGLSGILAGCINCYNCRVACPVCYCRECVFVTDTFRHDGEQYLKWSAKKGGIKMPTDTTFYHLTRMIHMSTLCVGCGQCSSACPNGIPLMELFATVSDKTQARFDYLPGRDLGEKQPLATFHDDEFGEVTGQVK